MNALLWVLQILLAVVFAAAGTLKLTQPRDRLIDTLGEWVQDFPAPLLKPLGLAELLAAAGVILPAATGIAPILTPIAALGLVVVMLGAIVTHAKRSEYPKAAVNLTLAVLAAAVAWTRFGPYPL
ncbi:DoxX family protein [Amycolatopsis acidicola]|uniref:DoxX family protein n=1 Tax=Amycolatopsis acidicola TaxID=2596893 RepID=A0A5N0V2Z1_9PSEU|nr:DoxX family protein [Amycolatopsis acidicola]KAA9160746.1 DoxX family protein [Amycolatopsis acidicola]